jgi:hypothetical protein
VHQFICKKALQPFLVVMVSATDLDKSFPEPRFCIPDDALKTNMKWIIEPNLQRKMAEAVETFPGFMISHCLGSR